MKPVILITDDSKINRALLSDMLSHDFEIREAADGEEALAEIRKNKDELSLLLLDINMPNKSGFDVLEEMRMNNWIDDVPVIMISSEDSSDIIQRAYTLGATDYISRPFDEYVVFKRVTNTIKLFAKQKQLGVLLVEQIYSGQKRNRMLINVLSHIVEFRNGESGPHVINVQILTDMFLRHIAKKTDKYFLNSETIMRISMASALHDIGKIAVPDEILNKPGRFTPEEFEVMKSHTVKGAEIIEAIEFAKEDLIFKEIREICRWHHERYDGRGYPDGLAGEDIPIGAQVVALADVYDALTSVRVYKPAMPHEEAVNMILEGKCGTFSPLLLECLTELAPKIKDSRSQKMPELTPMDIMEQVNAKLLNFSN